MLNQREIFDVAIKIFGSLKIVARHIETELDELETYFLETAEMPLRIYSEINTLIENEIEATLEFSLQSNDSDFLSLKRTRQKLGLSLEAMAKTLGLSGRDSTQLLHLMENGNAPMIGPVRQLVRYLSLIDLSEKVPYWSRFVICQPLPRHGKVEQNLESLMHTGYPRFVAKPIETYKVREDQYAVTLNKFQSLMVVIWIDSPEVMEDAVVNWFLIQAREVYEKETSLPTEQLY